MLLVTIRKGGQDDESKDPSLRLDYQTGAAATEHQDHHLVCSCDFVATELLKHMTNWNDRNLVIGNASINA